MTETCGGGTSDGDGAGVILSKQPVQRLADGLDGDGGHAAEEFGGRATNSAAIIAIVVQVPARDGGIGDQRKRMTVGLNRFVPGRSLNRKSTRLNSSHLGI